MRYKFIGIACVALVVGGGMANANVDFDDLLSTISFSDDQSGNSEELPAPVPQDKEIPQLNAANSESYDILDDALPSLDSLSDTPEVTAEEFSNDELLEDGLNDLRDDSLRTIPSLPNDISTPYGTSEMGDYEMLTPQQVEPVPYAPVAPGSETVDMDTLASAFVPANGQDCLAAKSVLENAGNISNSHAHLQQCGHHASHCNGRCFRPVPNCLPAPVLPPPTDANGMYRTPTWYRGLWSGYAEQKQHELSYHKHLLGTCNCARNGQCGCNRCEPQ